MDIQKWKHLTCSWSPLCWITQAISKVNTAIPISTPRCLFCQNRHEWPWLGENGEEPTKLQCPASSCLGSNQWNPGLYSSWSNWRYSSILICFGSSTRTYIDFGPPYSVRITLRDWQKCSPFSACSFICTRCNRTRNKGSLEHLFCYILAMATTWTTRAI